MIPTPSGARRALLALAAPLLAALAWSTAAQQNGTPAAAREPVAVLLVRHAEKSSVEPRDPGLSAQGLERAAELARTLGRARLTHLFASEYRRTRETLAPLAAATGLEVEVVAAGEAEAQLARLRALPPGSTALVCGHSNTVPALARALGVALEGLDAKGHFEESAYERLVLVVLPPGGAPGVAPRALELRYGD